MFVNTSGNVVYEKEVGSYNGESSISYSVNELALANGNYKVYLNLSSGEKYDGKTLYNVQFANAGSNSWLESIQANLVGEITINK